MSPAAILAHDLAAARRRGEAFEEAWPGALSSALDAAQFPRERREWGDILGEMVATWRAAWERRPVSSPEAALLMLAVDGGVPVPERARIAA